MIEFSRQQQEQRLLKEQDDELRKLTEEEIELEEKLQQLFDLDNALQAKSVHVSNLQEDRVGDRWQVSVGRWQLLLVDTIIDA